MAGFAFSPVRDGQNPSRGEYPPVADIDADLALLAGDVQGVRTYTVSATMADVPQLAAAHGIEVTAGAWLNDSQDFNETEVQRLVSVAAQNPRQVVRVIVGNEAVLREDLTGDLGSE